MKSSNRENLKIEECQQEQEVKIDDNLIQDVKSEENHLSDKKFTYDLHSENNRKIKNEHYKNIKTEMEEQELNNKSVEMDNLNDEDYQKIIRKYLRPKCVKVEIKKPKEFQNYQHIKTVIEKILNINLIYISLEYTNYQGTTFKWEVIKKIKYLKEFLKDFIDIYERIKKRKSIFQYNQVKNDKDSIKNIKTYSKKLKILFNENDSEDIKKILNFILAFIKIKLKPNEKDDDNQRISEFFEISPYSFDENNDGIKPKEGYIKKKLEYTVCQSTIIDICSCTKVCCCSRFKNYWFIVRKNTITYSEDSVSEGKNLYFFDYNPQIIQEGKYIKIIQESGKEITLYFDKKFELIQWYKTIRSTVDNILKNTFIFVDKSFAKKTESNKAEWFVDAKNYFEKLREDLLYEARETVFITDWWMSPELYLKRPVNFEEYTNPEKVNKDKKKNEDYINPDKVNKGKKKKNDDTNDITRLCDVLKKIANKGVKVYILVYKEKEVALPLNSAHTKSVLNSKNIKVVRHPIRISDILWSHHEKLVVIDQRICYVGGLDLCWGRYDTYEHPLCEPKKTPPIYDFPGIGYSNARIADFVNVENYTCEEAPNDPDHIYRQEFPRLPWHDVHSRIEGEAALDVARHFIERWNYIQAYEDEEGITQIKTGITKGRQRLKRKQQANFTNLRQFTDESGPNDCGKSDEEKNFNQVQNPTIIKKLLPKTPNPQRRASYFDIIMRNLTKKPEMIGLNKKNNKKVTFSKKEKKEKKMTVQCLRSLSSWSGGLANTEHSILEAYSRLITQSKHYIYIENQFFISKTFTKEEYESEKQVASDLIINEIGLKIRERIVEAHKKKEKFKVYIFIPLLPGFAGDFDNSSTLQVVCKYTYKTICRNNKLSLIEKLEEILKPDLFDEYISFYSLRNHGELKGKPVTEIIYIHSKLMIVDDQYVIMGSANINDRSMVGDRDSEFAVIYQNNSLENSVMNGNKEYEASFFAKSLRKRLWYEHLGIDFPINADPRYFFNSKQLDDPVSDETWNFFKERAKKNTEAYRYIFHCYPDDEIQSYKDFKNFNYNDSQNLEQEALDDEEAQKEEDEEKKKDEEEKKKQEEEKKKNEKEDQKKEEEKEKKNEEEKKKNEKEDQKKEEEKEKKNEEENQIEDQIIDEKIDEEETQRKSKVTVLKRTSLIINEKKFEEEKKLFEEEQKIKEEEEKYLQEVKQNKKKYRLLKKRYDEKKGEIKGHIVQFPLYFLKNETLQRHFFSCEMLLPIKNFV